MNSILLVVVLIAGTQAGFLHQPVPALYAAAPVAIASPVLTHSLPAYKIHSPLTLNVAHSYAAPALLTGEPLLKSHFFESPHVYTGAYAHHFHVPSYGYALKK